MERIQLIPYEIRPTKLHQYETKDSKSNTTRTFGEDINQRKFYKCFGVCTLCMVFLFIAYVPVTYHQARGLQANIQAASIVGWSPNSNRDLKQYVLPNNITSIIPGPDICPSPLFLLVIVCSSVANFEARLAIRETWASSPLAQSNLSVIRLAFLLGDPDNSTLQELVSDESSQYGDIIQEGFLDTYNNLTLKSVMLLKWVTTRCQGARYIMKTDDDMFVNMGALVSLLRNKGGHGLLLGSLICGAKPILDSGSKWFAPLYMFGLKFYPNYLSGTGYVMSFDVTKKLYQAALNTPLFHLEDVYITGICSKAAGIRPRDNAAFTFGHRKLDPCIYRSSSVVTSHRLGPQELRKIWAQMTNPLLDCSKSTTTVATTTKQDHKMNKQRVAALRKQVNKCF